MKALLFVSIVSILSCSYKEYHEKNLRHRGGEMVYLKPDSMKVLIVSADTCGCDGGDRWDYEIITGNRQDARIKESEIWEDEFTEN